MMIKLNSGTGENIAQVSHDGLLLVGLDGFTLEDIAKLYPGINIGIHVKDGDKWVPVVVALEQEK